MANRGRDVPLQGEWPPRRAMVVFDEADQLVLPYRRSNSDVTPIRFSISLEPGR
jgi:hypothetical protein